MMTRMHQTIQAGHNQASELQKWERAAISVGCSPPRPPYVSPLRPAGTRTIVIKGTQGQLDEAKTLVFLGLADE